MPKDWGIKFLFAFPRFNSKPLSGAGYAPDTYGVIGGFVQNGNHTGNFAGLLDHPYLSLSDRFDSFYSMADLRNPNTPRAAS